MKSIIIINRTIAGPNCKKLLINVSHSLTSAPKIMMINNTVEILVAVASNVNAKCLFLNRTNIPIPTGTAVMKNMVSPNDKIFNGGASAPIK